MTEFIIIVYDYHVKQITQRFVIKGPLQNNIYEKNDVYKSNDAIIFFQFPESYKQSHYI